MPHLIDKDALVAELKKRFDYRVNGLKAINNGTFWDKDQSEDEYNAVLTRCAYNAAKNEVFELMCFLDTLDVKDKDEVKIGEAQIYLEDDGGEPPYDGKQWLDLSCTEYEIPKDFKGGDNVEILIRKAQKGE